MARPRDPLAETMPPFPFAIEHVWEFYFEFAAGLKSDGMAPAQAGWPDVAAWSAAMQLDLEPYEMRLLVRLANLRASIQAEHQAEKSKNRR